MNLTLKRAENREDGVFSELLAADPTILAEHTIEHAYPDGSGGWIPKLAPGIYTCVRGMHRLHGMTEGFETFEVTGVPPFQGKPVTGLLIHWGNWNSDSEGCVCTGEREVDSPRGRMVTASRDAFQRLMAVQEGLDSFLLTVEA